MISNIPKTDPKSVREALKGALWLIENVGWCKFTMRKYNRDGTPRAYCAVGAVAEATDNLNESERALYILRSATPRNNGAAWHQPIPLWNDKRTTTKADVVKAFKKAIRKTSKMVKE